MSGAHVELNRNAPPGPDKEFLIRGNPDQIQHAMHLINEKVAVPPRGQEGPGGGRGGHHGGPGGPGQYMNCYSDLYFISSRSYLVMCLCYLQYFFHCCKLNNLYK